MKNLLIKLLLIMVVNALIYLSVVIFKLTFKITFDLVGILSFLLFNFSIITLIEMILSKQFRCRIRPLNFVKIVFPIYIFIGGFQLFGAISSIKSGIDTEEWSPIDAQITKSYLTHTRGGRRISHHKYFNIEYQYKVDGVLYNGNTTYDRWPVKTLFESEENNELWSNKFKTGTKAEVYFSPEKPAVSVAVPGLQADVSFYPLVGMIHIFFGIISFIPNIRRDE